MPGSDSTIANVSGQVWVSSRDETLGPGRCVVDQESVSIERDDARTRVAIDDISDISHGWTPEEVAHVAADALTFYFKADGDRELVTVAGDRDVIERLASLLYRLVLDGTEVIVAHPSWTDEQRHVTPPERATIRATDELLELVRSNDEIGLETDSITGYERVASGSYGGLPITIAVYRTVGESTVRTDVTFDSNTTINLFGRYLHDRAGAKLVAESSIRALIVDDEPGLAELIAELLERENERYSFVPLPGPVEAIEYLSENPRIDCIVSDYKMAAMDGIEFLEAVRQVRPNMPFILLTGKGSEELAETAFGTGATDYIRKESLTEQTDEIAERIERAVARTRPHLVQRGAVESRTANGGVKQTAE